MGLPNRIIFISGLYEIAHTLENKRNLCLMLIEASLLTDSGISMNMETIFDKVFRVFKLRRLRSIYNILFCSAKETLVICNHSRTTDVRAEKTDIRTKQEFFLARLHSHPWALERLHFTKSFKIYHCKCTVDFT